MYTIKFTNESVCILLPDESSSTHCEFRDNLLGYDQKKRLYLEWHSNRIDVSETTQDGKVIQLASRLEISIDDRFDGVAIKMNREANETYPHCGRIFPSKSLLTQRYIWN